MDKIIKTFLHSVTQTHIFHLGVSKFTGSYAAHLALEDYYSSISDMIDELVETYQGQNGIIKLNDENFTISTDCTEENILLYFQNLVNILNNERNNPDLSDSYIQDQIDDILKLLYKTIYKIKNLK